MPVVAFRSWATASRPKVGEGVNSAVSPLPTHSIRSPCKFCAFKGHPSHSPWVLPGIFYFRIPTTVDSRWVYLGCSLMSTHKNTNNFLHPSWSSVNILVFPIYLCCIFKYTLALFSLWSCFVVLCFVIMYFNPIWGIFKKCATCHVI